MGEASKKNVLFREAKKSPRNFTLKDIMDYKIFRFNPKEWP